MYRFLVKILAVTTVLSLANLSWAVPPDKQGYSDKPLASFKMKKPSGYKSLIQLNKQVYYSGDELYISVTIPKQLKARLGEKVEAQLLVYFPDGTVNAFPLVGEGKVLETTDTDAFAAGNYQLALVFTERGGNAVNVGDWYNGFTGLVSTLRLKISDEFPGFDEEDSDGDGIIDDDIDGDGFSDSDDDIIEVSDSDNLPVIGTLDTIESNQTFIERRLKSSAEVDKTAAASEVVDSLSMANEGGLNPTDITDDTYADSQNVDSVPVIVEEGALKPPVDEAIKLLFEMRTPVEECYGATGEPCTPDLLTPQLFGKYVANITLNPDKFSYQATLKTESEGIEKALAGKSIMITFEPVAEIWSCSPGSPNGLAHKYLPIDCR